MDRIGGWMDWMAGSVDGWVVRWIGLVVGLIGWVGQWMGWVVRWIGLVVGWNGWVGQWMDGWLDG